MTIKEALTELGMPSALAIALGYARQSRKQETEASPEMQEERISHNAAARGWVLEETFRDIGKSGYDPTVIRPGYEAMMSRVARGGISYVVVWKLDRLTRQGVTEAVRIVGELQRYGCALVSVEEPFLDTSTPMGRGIFALFAAMAEQEAEVLRTRTKGSKDHLRSNGKWTGGRVPYGMMITSTDAGKVLVKDPATAPILASIIARVLAGEAITGLTRDLNERGIPGPKGGPWGSTTLWSLLRSPQIAGWLTQPSGGVVRGADGAPLISGEPFVTPEEFYLLQEEIVGSRGQKRRGKDRSLLSGFLYCPQGHVLTIDRSHKYGGVYRCGYRKAGRCEGCNTNAPHTEDYVVRAVLARMAAVIADPSAEQTEILEEVTRRLAVRNPDVANLADIRGAEAQIADAMALLDQTDSDRAAGAFPGEHGQQRYTRLIGKQTERLEAARALLAVAKPAGDPLAPWRELFEEEYADPLEGPWASMPLSEKRILLSAWLDRVEVTKGTHGQRWTPDRLRLVWAGEGDQGHS